MTTTKSWAQTLGRSVRIIKNPYFCTCFLYSKIKQSCKRWSQEPSKLLEFHFSHLQNWNYISCFVEFLICYSTYILLFGCVYLSCSMNFHGGWKETAIVGEKNSKNKQLPIELNTLKETDKYFLGWRVIGLQERSLWGMIETQELKKEKASTMTGKGLLTALNEGQCWYRIESQRPISAVPYSVVPRPLAVSTFCF